MEIIEHIIAYGHRNVQATHTTTFEITKEREVTKKGDCIIAVSANKGLADLSSEFKEKLCRENARLIILLRVRDSEEIINAFGSPHLILVHPTDIVVRKSDYICSRTLAIHADKAACDFSKTFVQKLRNPEQRLEIDLTVKV